MCHSVFKLLITDKIVKFLFGNFTLGILHKPLNFQNHLLNWRIIALQCCVGFCHTTDNIWIFKFRNNCFSPILISRNNFFIITKISCEDLKGRFLEYFNLTSIFLNLLILISENFVPSPFSLSGKIGFQLLHECIVMVITT